MECQMLKCPQCGAMVREDRLEKHQYRVHLNRPSTRPLADQPMKPGEKPALPQVKKINRRYNSSALYTDDSGVVISQQQYAQIHGDTHIRKFRALTTKIIPTQTSEQATYSSSDILKDYSVTRYKPCPICKALFLEDRLLYHLQVSHPAALTPQKSSKKSKGKSPETTVLSEIKCPVCKVNLKSQARLEKHVLKVHGKKTNQKEIKQLSVPSKKHINASTSRPKKKLFAFNTISLDSFIQSMDEPRDGSKGLGHMRRESDGKFGSYPLHDDYSDESDSE